MRFSPYWPSRMEEVGVGERGSVTLIICRALSQKLATRA